MALSKEQRQEYDGLFPLDGTEYFEAPQPLVDGLIPKYEYTLLTGQPKVGKSTFAAHLSYAVATGEPFFGREVSDSGAVVYLAMERAYQTQQRINKLFELGEQQPRNIFLFKPQEWQNKSLFFNSDEQADVQRIIERIERARLKDIKLFVIDSLENTLIGSDSDSKDAGPWCNGLQTLLEHFESTGVVLHHETKASEGDGTSKTAYRGSSVFYARSGQWLRAMHRGKGVKLFAERGNFGSEWKQDVSFNDFGLYTDSMPELSKDKKPTQAEFIISRLIENPMVTASQLLQIVLDHEENTQWKGIGSPQISKAMKYAGDRVSHHPSTSGDAREKLLEYIG